MTNREFYTNVLNGTLTEETLNHARSELTKLDEKNAKRKTTQTKTQKENEGVKSEIVALLIANGSMVASEIGTALSITTQKASALCGQLVESKLITVADIKVKGKGTVKQYTAVATATAEDTSAEGEDGSDESESESEG